jgi:regulator of RNase E activity RraB
MGIMPGYSVYIDDRNQSIEEVVKDGSKPAKKWHERRRIDAQGVEFPFLLSEKNNKEFQELAEKQDKEFYAWFNSFKDDDETNSKDGK